MLRNDPARSPVLKQLDLAPALAIKCRFDANSIFGFSATCLRGGKTLQPE